jgi:YfiH family protein
VSALAATALGTTPHAFFGAEAGDCSLAGDDPKALANRRRAADRVLPGAPLVAAFQHHSATCLTVAQPWGDGERPQGDALATNRPGILLSILTADCAPVLLADREAGVVAAAHAGWRGALGGVTDAAVGAMIRLGAEAGRIVAAVGPCIAQRHYEVDETFRAAFLAEDKANARFFAESATERPHFDLEAYVCARLAAAGVARIEMLGRDTYGDEARFFSFRRATHRGQPGYGRQLTVIGLAPARAEG